MAKKALANTSSGPIKLNAFTGVFIPTVLSILGIILYVRLGYVVGSGGLLKTVLIILLSVSVTSATALALSALTTTLRIGPGGTYSIISKTLGLEVGGSVGIPLFVAQALSAVFYIYAFTEIWRYLFPHQSTALIVTVLFILLLGLSSFRLSYAMKAQNLVFGFLLIMLASILSGGGAWWAEIRQVPLLHQYNGEDFWSLFALFFPAVTGITTGIGLSGNLSDPKRQIPRGLLSAVAFTTLVYLLVALWLSYRAAPIELISDRLILFRLSSIPSVVIFGVMAASFMSALTRFTAAPRLLTAMCEHQIFPFCRLFGRTSRDGEPRIAVLLTAALVLLGMSMGSLDAIAPVLTMFFLMTYAIINIAVFIEMALGLVSFRPTIRIPIFVPLYGAVSAMVCMFLINVVAGLTAIVLLFATYLWLVQKNLKQKEGDIRSGLFVALSEWAAKKVTSLPGSTQHTWKPNILIPVLDSATVFGNFPLVKAIAYPNGTMTVLGMRVKQKKTSPKAVGKDRQESHPNDLEGLSLIVEKFGDEGIFTFSSVVDVDDFSKGLCVSLEAIESQVFHPNVVLLPFKPKQFSPTALRRIYDTARENQVSVMLFNRDEDMGMGSQEDIHVWISPSVLEKEFYDDRDFDLSLLTAYKLQQNWNGRITIWMCVHKNQKSAATIYLKKLVYEARLPINTQIKVVTSSFMRTIKSAPNGDLHIIAAREDDLSDITRIAKIKGKSFLFISDSTQEDVLA